MSRGTAVKHHHKKSSSTPADQCFSLKNYIQDYVNSYVNIPETEALVNDQMEAYEDRELNRYKELEAKRGVVDDDGFVTVISTKARTAALDAEITQNLSQGYFFDPYARLKSALHSSTNTSSNNSRKSSASTPLDNFYRFQVRQKRSNEVDELKRKFEEDKRRISELKKNKIFAAIE